MSEQEAWVYLTGVDRARLDPRTYRFDRVADHLGATIRNLDHHHIFGQRIQLRNPIDVDAESGEPFDVDGDRAMERTEMSVIQIVNLGDGVIVYTGFVEDRDPDRYSTGIFHMEQWTQYIPREDDK